MTTVTVSAINGPRPTAPSGGGPVTSRAGGATYRSLQPAAVGNEHDDFRAAALSPLDAHAPGGGRAQGRSRRDRRPTPADGRPDPARDPGGRLRAGAASAR